MCPYTYTLIFFDKSTITFSSQSSSFHEAYLEYCEENSKVPRRTYDYKREYDPSKEPRLHAPKK